MAKVKPAAPAIPPCLIFDAAVRDFSGNGLQCLSPISCEVTKKYQQAPALHMEHPVDDAGAWEKLALNNIILAPVKEHGEITRQPFRIYKLQKSRKQSGGPTISIDARHIFYDLNYVLLRDVRPTATNGAGAIAHLFQNIYRPTNEPQTADFFSYASDITTTGTAYYINKTLTAALIGEDNSILNTWAGELYVSEYYFSINSRQENARDNAFNLQYGYNLTAINAAYDVDKTYSAIIASANNGAQQKAGSVSREGLLPYDKTLYAQFNYNNQTPAGQFEKDYASYLQEITQINATYSINVADLPATDEYKEFLNLDEYEPGDTGRVFDKDLKIETIQKIIEKKIDVLTQQTKSVTLGNEPATITDIQRYDSTVTTGSQTAEQKAQTYTAEQIAALMEPKKTAEGAPPLSFTAATSAAIESWKIYGAAGGVGNATQAGATIPVVVNGSVVMAVHVPAVLNAGDYVERQEGGRSIAHYADGEDIELNAQPVISIRSGANTITTNTANKPGKITVIYK